jgi:hypothetical protein
LRRIIQPPHFAAHDFVLIEDIEENDEDFALAPENNAVFDMDMDGYHPLAIVPYAPPANPLLALLAEVHPVQVNNPPIIAVKEKVTMRRLLFENESDEPVQISTETICAGLPPVKKRGKLAKETPESEASV